MTYVKVSCCSMLVAVAAAAAFASGDEAGGGSDWPQYRGPDRNGISAETGILTSWAEDGPRVLWRTELGDGYSGIAVADGRAYTMYGRGDDEFVLCLDAGTGERLWRHRTDANRRDGQGGGPRSTPTVDRGIVYALGARGRLVALNAKNGREIWSRDLGDDLGARVPRWGVSTSPLVEDDRLLVKAGGSSGRSLVAFNRRNGEIVWTAGDDEPAYSSPIAVTIHGTRQVVFFTKKGLVAVSPDDGEEYWRVPWKTSWGVNAAMPIFLPPDRIFISTSYDVGATLVRVRKSGDGFRAEEVWRSRVMKNHFNTSVLHEGHIYGFDDATLKCIDAATGEQKWRARGFAKGSLIVADGHLIIFGERGQLAVAAASPEGYEEKARARIFSGKTWTMPTLSHGRLYLRNEEELLALDLRG